ncbi:hypothetical protein DO72_5176 [Burkholderia pseudomallei]|nr:hypothetical protein DO72_5176 [Burkholderia pseudomallei]
MALGGWRTNSLRATAGRSASAVASKLAVMRSRLEPSVAGTGNPNSSQSVGSMVCVPASFNAMMSGANSERSRA